GPHRQRRLVRHERARRHVLGQRPRRRVHPPEVRLPRRVVHEQRDHHDDRVRPRHRRPVVRRGPQPPRRHHLRQLLLQVRLTREPLPRRVDQVHHRLLDIHPGHLVPGVGELHPQGKPDLPQTHHRDPPRPPPAPGRPGPPRSRYPCRPSPGRTTATGCVEWHTEGR